MKTGSLFFFFFFFLINHLAKHARQIHMGPSLHSHSSSLHCDVVKLSPEPVFSPFLSHSSGTPFLYSSCHYSLQSCIPFPLPTISFPLCLLILPNFSHLRSNIFYLCTINEYNVILAAHKILK